MQVEPHSVSSSSPLSSLVASSNPSIQTAPPPAVSRANITYSRKPIQNQDTRVHDSSSSSQSASESDHLFDSPMRSYSRSGHLPAVGDSADQHTDHVTITADVSPATTAHAANSAIKLGPSSLFRRVDSQPSHNSDNDDQHESSTRDSPVIHRKGKFQLGKARAIFDSDSESDTFPPASTSKTTTNDDDHAIIARIRAQTVQDADSDPFTGSLSSVPPSSSQPRSSVQRDASSSDGQDTADHDITLTRRRGAKISAMRGKARKATKSKFSSSSDKHNSSASEDGDPVQAHNSRTFKLVSSASSTSATPADNNDKEAGTSAIDAASLRRKKIQALAAKARQAHGQAETDAHALADPLVDSFFGFGSPGRIPSRSPSLDIQQSDEDEFNDVMPAFMAARSKQPAQAKPKSKQTKPVALERDVLSDLEGDFNCANAKVASKRAAAATKEKVPPKVKPLSKKELENMHRQTARLARENRTRLAPTHERRTIGLNDLLKKIKTSAESNNPSIAATNDRSLTSPGQSSSQIPSGQSKSQHASDPIESDPIPERSSPHSNYISSPVVPVSRQQERRLGLDQSSSSAQILQGGPGRVGGLATKPEECANTHHPVAGAHDDNDDADLPDLASIVKESRDKQEAEKEFKLKQERLRQFKLRALEKSRQQQASARDTDDVAVDKEHVQAVAHEDDELEVYDYGSVPAEKHNLPTTPGNHRPTDALYRQLGIRPSKTPPSRKSYKASNVNGSPNAALHSGDNAEDQDEFVVTDDQLRKAGKSLFVATAKAAGQMPITQAHAALTQAPQTEAHAHPTSTHGAARRGPLQMTQAQLNATLMRKMQTQSLKARSQKEGSKVSKIETTGRAAAPNVEAMLESLQATAHSDGHHQDGEQDAGEDGDDPDFLMPAARSAESAIDSDVDMGSASEIEEADGAEDVLDFGSVDEDEENQDVEVAGLRNTTEEPDEEHDSEKENAPPPSSQQSQRSNASPSSSRSVFPSRAVMDDDEDELPAPRSNARRARRSALADDEADDEGDENPLQPGSFDRSRGNTRADEMSQSQDRPRVPLGDISSHSIDQSMPFSRSNTSSPAVQHAQIPGAAARTHRDPPIFPSTAGQDEDESFRTDEIPSQAGDLGRFFEPTIPPPAIAKSNLSQAPKSFWDQTQTQTQSQSQDQSQLPPQATTASRPLVRDESANSALGAFFQDTQQDELRGESLDIFDNPKNAGGKAHGFTQFFFDGTPPPTGESREKASPSVWDASTMPPPKSTEVDAFAALRKAQMGEAMDLLDTTPSVLPSFDESQAEREAYAHAQAEGDMVNQSPEKMYMNRDGFFTQTKPSQQMGLWSQYDSQSQSQNQIPGATGAAGVWPSPAPRGSAPPGTNSGQASPEQDATVSGDDERDEIRPVHLKRLRRGAASTLQQGDEAEGHQSEIGSESENDENNPRSNQPEPRARNAFDVLREGPLHTDLDESSYSKGKKRKSAFIEGEAEESEDEDLGGSKRGDGGGLKGIFGVDDASAGSGSEDDEDDADAADLAELVDNDREVDEALKDEVARARFRQDMEAKDREETEIHKKAIAGGYRNRRGRAGLDGLESFLDEDADEEEDRRKIAMMSQGGWKKRKLMDGTEDGMDKLAEHEEAKAFGQPKKIRYNDVRSAIRERRKAKQRGNLSDDNHGDDEERDSVWDSDENIPEARLASLLHDRIKAVPTPNAASFSAPLRNTQQLTRYGRKPAHTTAVATTTDMAKAMDVDPDSVPKDLHMDDADDDAQESLMARLLSRPTTAKATSSLFRLSSSIGVVDMLEDAEPEWGNDAGIIRAPKPSAGGAGTSQTSSSSSSFGAAGSRLTKNPFSTAGKDVQGSVNKKKKTAGGGASLLLKQGIMRRESGFSTSSSSQK
uniref:DNA replication checkpoint mediator MRC1 domain-containing protein n=1 Tax=Melanopsichium pennsylvanicum 4 TaxID=1398559 RepID=A0A077QTC2_9BASI|nr:hypothetical protein BN887_05109 [Melanopsichium pennsylvanicum 4]